MNALHARIMEAHTAGVRRALMDGLIVGFLAGAAVVAGVWWGW